MKKSRWLLSTIITCAAVVSVSACASVAPEDVDETQGSSEDALRSAVNCKETAVTGYKAGAPYAMSVITVGGKPTARSTAHAFLKMQAAAERAGVTLSISSAFRTQKEQQYFYNCYLSGACNGGHLAAKPGRSPHQNGRALDLAASDFGWLTSNAHRFGFAKTVPSERWHFEFSGADPGGPCSGGAAPMAPAQEPGTTANVPTPAPRPADAPADPTADPNADPNASTDQESDPGTPADVPLPPSQPADVGGCYSPTMGKTMEEKSCVQSSADDVMYQCHAGSWYRNVVNGVGRYGACTSIHTL
ncbi:MAG: D-alanyl-D-alanine carboxypeptidase [Myxococcaceae bacterium]|nr:D-alanyl-D-alanine carboxypeptidase [Myxococcaceae bacterium]